MVQKLTGFAGALLAAGLFCSSVSAQSDEAVLTLYRNSPLDSTMRIHIATFDSVEGKD